MDTKTQPPSSEVPAETRARFAAWVREVGGSRIAAGRIGVARSYVDMLRGGQRSPGLRTACRIEQLTDGAIKMRDWIGE